MKIGQYEVKTGAVSLSNGLYMSVYDVFVNDKFRRRLFGADNTSWQAAKNWADAEVKQMTERDLASQ